MTLELYLFQAFVQSFYLISFALSIREVYGKNLPNYMRSFFWYPFVGVILIILFWLNVAKLIPNFVYHNLNKISVGFHYVFLAHFICKVIFQCESPRAGKFILWVSSTIIIGLVGMDYINKSGNGFSFANLFLFVLCLIYYNQLFQKKPFAILLDDPSFWIITGVFLGMGITIPAYFFNEFLFYSIGKHTYYTFMLSVGIGYAIMHIFFIKALICKNGYNRLSKYD